MLPGMQGNPCGTTWFVRNREEELSPATLPTDSSLDGPITLPLDSVHLSAPPSDPLPPAPHAKVRQPGRSPFAVPRLTRGERSVALAYQFYQRLSDPSLRKDLPRFQAAGGVTNNCADFVSAILNNTGGLVHHFNTVPGLEKGLQHEGWVAIPASQARPGDVWTNGTHAEIVARKGGTRLIGSNNGGHWYQTITDHAQNPSQGHYWGRR